MVKVILTYDGIHRDDDVDNLYRAVVDVMLIYWLSQLLSTITGRPNEGTSGDNDSWDAISRVARCYEDGSLYSTKCMVGSLLLLQYHQY